MILVQVNGPLLRKLLHKRIAILPSTLRTRTNEYKADLVQQFRTVAWPAFASGQLKLVCHSYVFSAMSYVECTLKDHRQQDVSPGAGG